MAFSLWPRGVKLVEGERSAETAQKGGDSPGNGKKRILSKWMHETHSFLLVKKRGCYV